jgi:hypothetical protein
LGGAGAVIALIIAAVTNRLSYWNADKLVLSMHDAQEVDGIATNFGALPRFFPTRSSP